MADRKVIIAGGGIGGLTAALSLAKRGIRSVVLERAPELGEIGAGIQLGPNAFRVFDELGVGKEARATAVYIERIRLMDAMTAEDIISIDLGEQFRKRFNNPYAVVHRGELHGVFVKACVEHPLVELRTNAEVTGYEQDGASVRAILSNGEKVEGVALIGADGGKSAIRKQMLNDGAPRVPGHTTFRSVIPIEQMPEDLRWNAVTLWAGDKCHLVHYPLSGYKVMNLVITVHDGASEVAAGVPIATEEVAKKFVSVHEKAKKIISHGKDWKYWVLSDRDPITNWTQGRVALLGDAAHPTLQYMAQGACMAMEDSLCLGIMIDKHADVDKALQAYCEYRRMRAGRVVLQSRALGEHVYHPTKAHRLLRDSILRAKTTEDFCDDLEWIYGDFGIGDTPGPARYA